MGKYWRPLERASSWRKLSIGMWDPPADPTIYGFETMDVTDSLAYLEAVRAASGVNVGMTTLVVAAMARMYRLYPELNVILVGERVQQRNSVDVFCQVAIPNEDAGRADLSGIKLRDVDRMDIVQIHQALHQRAKKVRDGQDKEIESQKRLFDLIPPRVMRRVVKLVEHLTYEVPIDLDAIGIRSDPFGSCMVSSVAQFDIRLGFAPLVPASRTPLILLPGVVYDEMRFVGADPTPRMRKMVQISLTCDHRCFDGYQIGVICREFRTVMTDPAAFLPAPETFIKYTQRVKDEPPRPEDHAMHNPPSANKRA
jgi:pyruvate/2-oxoglutarate dehydrogenase complex dihydrolipoamide acyltransferase (E2) component